MYSMALKKKLVTLFLWVSIEERGQGSCSTMDETEEVSQTQVSSGVLTEPS